MASEFDVGGGGGGVGGVGVGSLAESAGLGSENTQLAYTDSRYAEKQIMTEDEKDYRLHTIYLQRSETPFHGCS